MTNTLISKIATASKTVGALKADKTNAAQNYDYISADKILERAGDALANVGVVILPSITEESTQPVNYTDGYGKAKTRFDAMIRFSMIVTDGETQMEIGWLGRGSDFSVPDKAVYKAITSGHKYFLMKLLNVGVGNEDGEHENEPQAAQAATKPAKANKPVENPFEQPDKAIVAELNTLGHELYGAQWPTVRQHNTERISDGQTKNVLELSTEQIGKLIAGLQKVKTTRKNEVPA